ncbi:MAG: phosphotransferase [Clostridia bacterium]|nr:phosphotransferase [Clostridia bacterium]
MDAASVEAVFREMDASAFTGVRWYRHKALQTDSFELSDFAVIQSEHDAPAVDGGLNVQDEPGVPRMVLAILRFPGAGDYFVPALIGPSGMMAESLPLLGTVAGHRWDVRDAAVSDEYANLIPWLAGAGRQLPTLHGRFEFRLVGGGGHGWRVKKVGDAYTNTIAIARRGSALKTFRLLTPGTNPDVEIGVALAKMTEFRETPRVEAEVAYVGADGVRYSVAVQTEEVPSVGDAWEGIASALDGALRIPEAEHPFAVGPASCAAISELGATIARLHAALASVDAPGFGCRRADESDVERWDEAARTRADLAVDAIADCMGSLGPEAQHAAARVLESQSSVRSFVCGASIPEGAVPMDLGHVMRCHGDLHLGQILVKPDGGYAVIDFEGEPLAPVEERRALASPARDIAGMLRSLSYAAKGAVVRMPKCSQDAYEIADAWERESREAFLSGYLAEERRGGRRLLPPDDVDRTALIRRFEIEKALYEVNYELNNRPDWSIIPLTGVCRLIDRAGGGAE